MNVHCDLLVVGGGTSGVPAAVSAARQGLNTVLIEKNPYLGGTGVDGLHRVICGLYGNTDPAPVLLHPGGIVEEILLAMNKPSLRLEPVKVGKVYVLPYSIHQLESVYREMVEAEERIQVFYSHCLKSVSVDHGVIKRVDCTDSKEVKKIFPRLVIDASGNGLVLVQCKIPYREVKRSDCQPAGYILHVAGLREAETTLPLAVPYHLYKGVLENLLPEHLRFTTFSLGDDPCEGFLKLCCPPFHQPDRDQQARIDGESVLRFLKETVRAFAGAWIRNRSPQVLDREGPRLCGRQVLTGDEVVGGKKSPKSRIKVKCGWPIELWNQTKGPRYTYLNNGEVYYEIPEGCLISNTISNLLCAGRTISVTRRALASTRVMGCCMALGEAAGRLASIMIHSS